MSALRVIWHLFAVSMLVWAVLGFGALVGLSLWSMGDDAAGVFVGSIAIICAVVVGLYGTRYVVWEQVK